MILAAIPTHDFAAKSGRAQGEAHGCAEQAGAENGDALDHLVQDYCNGPPSYSKALDQSRGAIDRTSDSSFSETSSESSEESAVPMRLLR